MLIIMPKVITSSVNATYFPILERAFVKIKFLLLHKKLYILVQTQLYFLILAYESEPCLDGMMLDLHLLVLTA